MGKLFEDQAKRLVACANDYMKGNLGATAFMDDIQIIYDEMEGIAEDQEEALEND